MKADATYYETTCYMVRLTDTTYYDVPRRTARMKGQYVVSALRRTVDIRLKPDATYWITGR